MKRTSSRPKLVVTADGRGVVGHAGTRMLADLADATGLSTALSEALASLRQQDRGHDPGRVAVDLAVMLADGGEAIADLAVLRNRPPRQNRAQQFKRRSTRAHRELYCKTRVSRGPVKGTAAAGFRGVFNSPAC